MLSLEAKELTEPWNHRPQPRGTSRTTLVREHSFWYATALPPRHLLGPTGNSDPATTEEKARSHAIPKLVLEATPSRKEEHLIYWRKLNCLVLAATPSRKEEHLPKTVSKKRSSRPRPPGRRSIYY